MDTIFALASARGKAGVAVVRVSGPRAHDVVLALAGKVPKARHASLRTLRLGPQVLDHALVLVFEEHASFTGEASAEFHLHGGRATVQAVLSALGNMAGLRAAEPGEFTRRALENGRLDLSQVEGLADLIEAETEAQRRQAQRVMEGGLRDRVSGWRQALVRAGALLEATIDFADEDVPVDVAPEVKDLLQQVLVGAQRELANSRGSERLREGFEVAIVGSPNAGKSTLLNWLAGRDAAITSEIAGTTRDVIEVRMDVHGLPVTLLDTAGLRETDDVIEREGVARSLRRAASADLRVFLLTPDETPTILVPAPEDLVVCGKGDLYPGLMRSVSGKTGAGVEELLTAVAERLSSQMPSDGVLIRERHKVAMARAVDALEAAIGGLQRQKPVELIAADVRSATLALSGIVGNVDVESLLDEIFSSFCIGK